MPRIVYLLLSNGGLTGGHKMIVRHVETLRDLGFDAHVYIGRKIPAGLEHRAPLEVRTPVRRDDIVVLPDDGPDAINTALNSPFRSLIFTQNPFTFAVHTYDLLDRFAPERFPEILAVSPGEADTVRRAFPQAKVHVIPCFADERVFRPAEKVPRVALSPRKRQMEARVIRQFFRRLHPRHREIPWQALNQASEQQVAAAFGEASVHLSLNRLESVGITTLEAMACGCVCAGFLGVGGRAYATADNGFWAPDDDCLAAADALAQACDVAQAGGPELKRRVEAARATAEAWSFARFRPQLEAVWMELAPEARLKDGPLD